MKKLKDKANAAAERVLDKKIDEKAEEISGTNSSGRGGNPGSSTSSKSNPRNKGGAGLISTPPDVKENLAQAETSFSSGKYSEARYAVQQAMLGVELQIGQNILKSLPQAIGDLKYDPAADQVTSTGWGWAGLTIYREYGKDDKQLRFSVANNAVWM